MPLSKLTFPATPNRALSSEGAEVEIFYEPAWSSASPVAPQARSLVEQISTAMACLD